MDKIEILFLAANPTITKLALDDEIHEITQKIRMAEYRDTLNLIDAWSVQLDSIRLRIRYPKDQPASRQEGRERQP